MPLSADSIIQENSGVTTTAGTSVVVSLPAGTTAGDTLVVITSSNLGLGAPAGFVEDKNVFVDGSLSIFSKSEVPAAETSWTFTAAGNTHCSWYVAELADVDPIEPLDASATNFDTAVANGETLSTGTTVQNAAINTVVLGAFLVKQVTGTDVQSWSSYTNDFQEVVDIAVNINSTYQLAVARKFVTDITGTFQTTATLATSTGTPSAEALTVAYRAADSPIVAPLAHLLGFEWGTHGGMGSHNGSTNLMGSALVHGGTWGTDYLVQAGSARTGSYGLRVVQPGAAAFVRAGTLSSKSGSIGFNVRVVSATGTVVVAEVLTSATSVVAQLLYDATNSKFGVRCGSTGTTSWQSGTTATNTWVWVDLRVKVSTSTWRAEWRIETGPDTYTDQAAAELTGQTVTALNMLNMGANTAQTVTADFDDVCLSSYWVAYPLGPHQVRLLTVDTAATVTYSGTPGNFSKFTANGTLTTLAGSGGNITTSDVATMLDETPPTISASADGVCQTATATSDYLQFPMAAPTVAADEVVDGVRMLAAMWGGAGAGTGTVGLRGWDGTTETTLVAASNAYDAGSPTAISSTEPRWQCAIWPSTNGWTVTELTAAAVRFGFSTDAAPDMGTDALYLEYATRKAVVQPLFGTLASQALNPNTVGIRSVIVDTTATGQAADLYYEESGSPTTVPVAASTTHTETIDAPDMPSTNYVAIYPDPEP